MCLTQYSLEDTAIDDHFAQVGFDGHASQDATQGSQLIVAVQGMHRWKPAASTMVVRQWRLVQSTNTLVFLVVKKVQASVEQVIKQLANLVVMAFSSLARTFGEGLTVLPVLFFFFLKWRSAHAHQFHFLSQDRSTVAQQAEITVAECSLMSCVWAWFPELPTLRLDSTVSPLQLRWVKDVCMFGCHLPPTLLAEWLGSFMWYCDNTGWNGHRRRVSTESSLWRRQFSRCSCRDWNSQPFNRESRALPTPCPGSFQQTLPHALVKHLAVSPTFYSYCPTSFQCDWHAVLCRLVEPMMMRVWFRYANKWIPSSMNMRHHLPWGSGSVSISRSLGHYALFSLWARHGRHSHTVCSWIYVTFLLAEAARVIGDSKTLCNAW